MITVDDHLFLCVCPEGVEDRHKIYEDSWVKFPKGLVPRRLPLNFLTGKHRAACSSSVAAGMED